MIDHAAVVGSFEKFGHLKTSVRVSMENMECYSGNLYRKNFNSTWSNYEFYKAPVNVDNDTCTVVWALEYERQ